MKKKKSREEERGSGRERQSRKETKRKWGWVGPSWEKAKFEKAKESGGVKPNQA